MYEHLTSHVLILLVVALALTSLRAADMTVDLSKEQVGKTSTPGSNPGGASNFP